MPETAQERTEEATPRRRQQARRKGTVARSTDLTGALVLLAIILVLPAAVGHLGQGFMTSVDTGFRTIPMDVQAGNVSHYVASVLQPTLTGLVLIVGAAMMMGLAANFAQVGFVMSVESMTPSLSKLNPIEGLKRLFSMRATFEGMKATAKFLVFMLLAWSAIQSSWPQLIHLSKMTPLASLATIGLIIRSIALRIAVVWLVLAVIDYLFQRKQTNKQLRMTKEELKQEMKEAETSPELRAAQHARRRKLSKGRLVDAIRGADVIVTNPTHYAVAIQYEAGKSHAPVVVAKGADYLAARIRELAAESRVPLIPNPPLARALYRKCEVGDTVPRELFQAVAEVLAYVYKTLKQMRA